MQVPQITPKHPVSILNLGLSFKKKVKKKVSKNWKPLKCTTRNVGWLFFSSRIFFFIATFAYHILSPVSVIKGTSNCLAEFEKTLKLPLKFFWIFFMI